jgi:hypothetical protein
LAVLAMQPYGEDPEIDRTRRVRKVFQLAEGQSSGR